MNLMAFISNLSHDTRLLKRFVIWVLGVVIVVGGTFGGYYYWDRYVHLGDKSPLELGAEHLEQMVRENPEDPDTRIALAQYYFESGSYAKTLEQTQQVLSAFPDHEGALFLSGMAYTSSGELKAAIEPLEKFAEIRRQSPMAGTDTILETALYFLGQDYVNLRQPEQAQAVLKEALTIDQTDADAMYQLGLAYNQTGQDDLAIEQYNNAVRFVPDFTEAYQGMQVSYAVLAMPDYVLYARGMEAFSLQDYDQAKKLLEQSAEQLPDFAPVHLGLGLVYEVQGDLEAALAEIQKVLKLAPNNFMANHALGRIQTAMSENQ